MPMIRECDAVGCSTLTMGALCLDHEREVQDVPKVASKPEAERRAASHALRRANVTRARTTPNTAEASATEG
jgi:butyrate kinase